MQAMQNIDGQMGFHRHADAPIKNDAAVPGQGFRPRPPKLHGGREDGDGVKVGDVHDAVSCNETVQGDETQCRVVLSQRSAASSALPDIVPQAPEQFCMSCFVYHNCDKTPATSIHVVLAAVGPPG